MGNSCPHGVDYIILKAKQGQKIHVKVFDVTAGASTLENLGGIVDQGLEHQYEISQDPKGFQVGSYVSESHEVTLDLRMPRNTVIVFHGELCFCGMSEQICHFGASLSVPGYNSPFLWHSGITCCNLQPV